MKNKLETLLNNAYAPYSNFHVASIVVMKDKTEFNGVNVENVSFGGTICAERNAINNAIAAGYKPGDFETIYIMTKAQTITYPCMICRQTMVELFDKDVKVILMNEHEEKHHSLDEIIINAFKKEDLN